MTGNYYDVFLFSLIYMIFIVIGLFLILVPPRVKIEFSSNYFLFRSYLFTSKMSWQEITKVKLGFPYNADHNVRGKLTLITIYCNSQIKGKMKLH